MSTYSLRLRLLNSISISSTACIVGALLGASTAAAQACSVQYSQCLQTCAAQVSTAVSQVESVCNADANSSKQAHDNGFYTDCLAIGMQEIATAERACRQNCAMGSQACERIEAANETSEELDNEAQAEAGASTADLLEESLDVQEDISATTETLPGPSGGTNSNTTNNTETSREIVTERVIAQNEDGSYESGVFVTDKDTGEVVKHTEPYPSDANGAPLVEGEHGRIIRENEDGTHETTILVKNPETGEFEEDVTYDSDKRGIPTKDWLLENTAADEVADQPTNSDTSDQLEAGPSDTSNASAPSDSGPDSPSSPSSPSDGPNSDNDSDAPMDTPETENAEAPPETENGPYQPTQPDTPGPDDEFQIDPGTPDKLPPDAPCCGPPNSSGEPHIYTFDGLAYDFQAVGEFVLAETFDLRFTVQTRQSPYGKSGSVSANTAIAVKFDENVISYDLRDGPDYVYLNGKRIGFSDLSQSLVNIELRQSPNAWTLYQPGLGGVYVYMRQDMLDISVQIDDSDIKTRGLLGNRNGYPNDDIEGVSGSVDISRGIAQEVLYGTFADKWRVSDDTTLFHYRAGEATHTFQDRLYPNTPVQLNDLDPTWVKTAQTACRDAGLTHPVSVKDCIFDVAIMADTAFATNYPDAGEQPLDPLPIHSGAIDLSTWKGLTLPDKMPATWDYETEGRIARLVENLNRPSVLLSETIEDAFRISAKVEVKQGWNKDHIGFVLGFTDAVPNELDFLLLDWKHSAKRYRGQPAPEGWRLTRYKGQSSKIGPRQDPDIVTDFWAQSNSDLHTPLAENVGPNTGWRFDQTYRIEIAYSSDRIKIFQDGEIVLDVTGKFPEAGRFGLYNYSQPDHIIRDVIIY